MSHNHFGDDEEEMTEEELWEQVSNATGAPRANAMITLSQRMFGESRYSEAASLQERLAEVFVEDDKPDDALIALARATGAWMEAEEWDNIEEVAVRAAELEDKAFNAESWRDYYSSYAWAAHQRRAAVVALEYIDRAITYADEMDSDHNRATLLWQKGCIIATFGRAREAMAIMDRALEFARSSAAIPLIVDILAEMALLEIQLLNPDRAVSLATEAQTLLADTFGWPPLRHRVTYSLGSAYLAAGRSSEAVEQFESIVGVLPNYLKVRTMIRLSECMTDKADSWESRAYTLARNTNAWDLLNHLEINRAMKTDAMFAVPVLDTVVARAVEYDDDVTRDAARLVLARKYMELGDFSGAMDILSRISAANFGDDMIKVITYLVLRVDALIETGDLVEARAIATTLTRLDPRPEFVSGIAEGFWQLSLIENQTNGQSLEWERLAHACIAHLARVGDYELLAKRADLLRVNIAESGQKFRSSIETVDDLLADIHSESTGFGEAAA
ncbi:MAG: hypothetical protein RLZZ587_64 [Actinomycetota bacterium]